MISIDMPLHWANALAQVVPKGTRAYVFERIYTVFLLLGTLVGVVVIAYMLQKAYKYRASRARGDDCDGDDCDGDGREQRERVRRDGRGFCRLSAEGGEVAAVRAKLRRVLFAAPEPRDSDASPDEEDAHHDRADQQFP